MVAIGISVTLGLLINNILITFPLSLAVGFFAGCLVDSQN